MKYALILFYLHTWQIEAFTASEAVCRQLAHDVREVVANPRPWACVRVADEPIYYSR